MRRIETKVFMNNSKQQTKQLSVACLLAADGIILGLELFSVHSNVVEKSTLELNDWLIICVEVLTL